MSKHIFHGVLGGRLAKIEIGWDEPLRHYFMQITANSATAGGHAQRTVCEYSNLGDPALDGGTADPTYYWNKLSSLGIECPFRTEIDVELQLDALGGGSNRAVSYDTLPK